MRTFWADLRFAARLLGRTPGLTLAAVLTLALGIGVNTAVFSAVNAVMLRPLPVPDADRIVVLASRDASEQRLRGVCAPDLSPYHDITGRAFAGIAGYVVGFVTLLPEDGPAEWVLATSVTGNYFTTLGLEPAVGRLIEPEEVAAGRAAPVAVLGYRTWQRRFGGDPSVVGQLARINGRPVTIAGVAPASFAGTFAFTDTAVYLPLNWADPPERLACQHAFGRLHPRVRASEAQHVLDVAAARLAEDHPDAYSRTALAVVPERLARPEEDHARWMARAAGATLVLAALVLAIAAVNAANLMLARSVDRQRELAIRAALGAGRRRIVRQLLTESLLLAAMGGMAGVALGALTARALELVRLPDDRSAFVLLDFSADGIVLAYSAAFTMLAALLVGLAPAARVLRTDMEAAIHVGARPTRSIQSGRPGVRGALVVAQVAACFVLLATAVLFVRSLAAAERVDLGFDPQSVLNVTISTDQVGYGPERARQFFDDVEQRIGSLPGVEQVAFALTVPLGYVRVGHTIHVEGAPIEPGPPLDAGVNVVSPTYFETMRIPLLQGRVFTPADDERSRPVAVVNERFADLFWPGEDPVGRRFSTTGPDGPWVEVIGITPTGKYESFAEDPVPFAWFPLSQRDAETRTLHVRTSLPPESLAPAVERTLRDLEPDLALLDVMSLARALGGGWGFFGPRLVARFAAILGALALALVVVGLYGLVSYTTRRRTHEIGVRIAFGAMPADITRLVLSAGVRLAAGGILAGAVLALGVAHAVAGFLFGVPAHDPLTFAGVAAFLVIVALAASARPASRAARLDPARTLREDA